MVFLVSTRVMVVILAIQAGTAIRNFFPIRFSSNLTSSNHHARQRVIHLVPSFQTLAAEKRA